MVVIKIHQFGLLKVTDGFLLTDLYIIHFFYRWHFAELIVILLQACNM